MNEEKRLRAVVEVRNNERPADVAPKPLLEIRRIGRRLAGQRERRGIECGVVSRIIDRTVDLVARSTAAESSASATTPTAASAKSSSTAAETAAV